jgi:hypothetical protein
MYPRYQALVKPGCSMTKRDRGFRSGENPEIRRTTLAL